MSYLDVDPVIISWVSDHGFKLNDEFGSVPRRFFYVSARENESFQVSIEPPEDETVSVNVWSVETEDDAELHHSWTVPLGELRPILDLALKKIEEWEFRPRN